MNPFSRRASPATRSIDSRHYYRIADAEIQILFSVKRKEEKEEGK